MKKKLQLFGCCILLVLHAFLVYVVPAIPWFFVVKHGHDLGFVLMAIITLFIQLPIMVYATTKKQGIFERLVMKIRKLADEVHE